MMTLAAFDELSRDRAVALLKDCCGSTEWAERMARARPHPSLEALLEKSDAIWWTLRRDDWLEAFSAHPRLGDSSGKSGSRSASWSRGEQATVVAETEAQGELRRLNEAYEERFGWIFILCATGKSAGEVMSSLQERLKNEDAEELRQAAEEQNRITRLRLRKLFEPATVTALDGGR